MTAILAWRVAPMQELDLPEVIALAAEEPTAPHWPPQEYRRLLEVIEQTPERRAAWVLREAHLPSAASADPPIAGFCMASHVAGIGDLEAVVVRTASRGRRGGQALVQAAADWARALHASHLQLEVRASNTAALRLYQRMGFAVDGARPAYYRNPEEDAALMSLRLE